MYVNLLRGIQSIHPYSFQDIKNNILNEKQRCETTTARLSTNKLKDTTPKLIKIVDTLTKQMREIPQNEYALEAKGKKKVPRNGFQIIGK
jgi:hypothetical protein